MQNMQIQFAIHTFLFAPVGIPRRQPPAVPYIVVAVELRVDVGTLGEAAGSSAGSEWHWIDNHRRVNTWRERTLFESLSKHLSWRTGNCQGDILNAFFIHNVCLNNGYLLH